MYWAACPGWRTYCSSQDEFASGKGASGLAVHWLRARFSSARVQFLAQSSWSALAMGNGALPGETSVAVALFWSRNARRYLEQLVFVQISTLLSDHRLKLGGGLTALWLVCGPVYQTEHILSGHNLWPETCGERGFKGDCSTLNVDALRLAGSAAAGPTKWYEDPAR